MGMVDPIDARPGSEGRDKVGRGSLCRRGLVLYVPFCLKIKERVSACRELGGWGIGLGANHEGFWGCWVVADRV